MSEIFGKYLTRWRLIPDGDPILTRGSRLLPVRMEGTPAMLKVAIDAEEKFGGLLMSCWDGQGAARVFAHEEDALLMERAEGPASLADMAQAMAPSGGDDEASRLICRVVAGCMQRDQYMEGARFQTSFRLRGGSGRWSPRRQAWRNFSRVRGNGTRTAGIGAGCRAVAWRHPPRQYSRLRPSRMASYRSQGFDWGTRLRLRQPVLQS